VEDVRVRHPCNWPSRPSNGGGSGGGRLAPWLGAELVAELSHSASSVEDGLILVVGVLDGGLRRGLICVIHGPRKVLRDGFVAREPDTRHLHDSSPGVGMVCHCYVPAEHRRRRLIKETVGGKRKSSAREWPFAPRA
jgi:hypothetical protein